MAKLSIIPTSGYLLCEAFIEKDKPFRAAKLASGEDHQYKVLAVGADVIDTEGITRKSPAKVGDIVIGIDSSSTFELDFTRYYFLHFTQCHGVFKK